MISCNNKTLNRELEVINDAFLTVTDTVAYYELSLRPPPPPNYFENNMEESYSNPLYKHLAVAVPDTLYPFVNDIWTSTISLYCKGWSIDEKPSIIELKNRMCKIIKDGTEPEKFNINSLKDIGRYILIKNSSVLKSDIPIVGKVQFSQVVFNKEDSLAAFAALISDGGNLFIEKLFILSREDGKWKVIKTEVLSVS